MDEIFLLFPFLSEKKSSRELSFCMFRWFRLRSLTNIQDNIMNMACVLISGHRKLVCSIWKPGACYICFQHRGRAPCGSLHSSHTPGELLVLPLRTSNSQHKKRGGETEQLSDAPRGPRRNILNANFHACVRLETFRYFAQNQTGTGGSSSYEMRTRFVSVLRIFEMFIS